MNGATHNIASATRAIINARTLQDIWSIPMPQVVRRLDYPDRLQAFITDTLSLSKYHDHSFAADRLTDNTPLWMAESVQISQDIAANSGRAWTADAALYKSGILEHGQGIHGDTGADTSANTDPTIIVVAVTKIHTMSVSHADTLAIVSDYASTRDVLTLDIRDKQSRDIFVDKITKRIANVEKCPQEASRDDLEFARRMRAALRPLPLNTACTMTRFTLHEQEQMPAGIPIPRDRVFFGALIYFAPK